MNCIEIRKAIDLNYKLIEDAMAPNMYVLNTLVAKLLKENEELQKQCTHETIEDGICIFCDKEI